MVNSYIRSIIRSLKSSFSRFLAIFAIVALGVGFLAGLLSATPDMRHSVEVYFNDTRLMDIQVMGNLGLGDEDLQALAAVEGVEEVQGVKTADLLAVHEQEGLVLRAHSMDFAAAQDSHAINRRLLAEGRWPESPSECVMEFDTNLLGGLKIGDIVTFTEDNKDLADTLSRTEFQIVGVVSSSYYLNMTQRGYTTVGSGKLGGIVYLPESAFATDYYTEAFLSLSGSRDLTVYSADYEALADQGVERVETLAETQKYVRRDALVDDAEQQLEEARDTLAEKQAEAEEELEKARRELEDGERELEEAEDKLARGRRDYDQGVADLAAARADYQAEITDAQAQIDEGRAELIDARAELDDGWRQLNEGESELEQSRPELEDGRRQLEDAIAQFNEAEQKIIDGEREIEENRQKIKDGKAALEAAHSLLQDGAEQLQSGRQQLIAGEAQLAEAQAQYEQGLAMLEALNASLALADQYPDELAQLLGLLSGASTEEIVAGAGTFLVLYGPTVADIADRQSRGEPVEDWEVALLTIYRNVETQMDDPEQLAAYIESLQQEYAQSEAVLAELVAQRDSLTAQLNDARVQLEGAQRQLEEGRRQLLDGEAAYSDGVADYLAGVKEIEEAERLLLEGEQALIDGRAELEANRPELMDAMAEFAENEALFLEGAREIAENRQKLTDGEAEYQDGLLELEDAERQLEEGKLTAAQEFADAERKLSDALVEMADGEAQLEDGRLELEDGWAEYLDAELEVAEKLLEAKDALTEAEDTLRTMEAPKWYVLSRESNAGYVSYRGDSDKIEAIARVFPIFFFMVATLVASTTMTRMVDEERGNIGTLKALGYTNGAIAGKFIFYAATAAILGSVAGLAIGLNLFPSIIYNAYGMMYNLPPMSAAQHGFYGSISTLAICLGILLATVGALRGALKENAASLMRPKAPPEGKRIFLERITPLWRRMRFTHKVTARNLIRYKKRFFMTLIGIFGCTALLLCGFGLRDSISDIVNIQFGEIFTYNMQITLKHDGDHMTDSRISRVVDNTELVAGYAAIHMENAVARVGESSQELSLIATDDWGGLAAFVTLRDRKSGQLMPMDEQTLFISEKAASSLGLKAGDTLSLENNDGTRADFTVTGVVENYVQGYLYMSESLYRSGFGRDCEYTTLLGCTADPAVEDDASQQLLRSPNVVNVTYTDSLVDTFDEMMDVIDYIVVVLIVSAGLLAFVVMYNLTNINITERIKELATIKVLGFTQGETAAYIFRETTILTLLGAFVGLAGGVALQRFIVVTVEVDNMMFGRVIKPMSYVLALVITLIFSSIVDIIMNRKLRRINMAEALKAPE